jgi:hypothetical protein
MASSSRCRRRLHSLRFLFYLSRPVVRGMMSWATASAARRVGSFSPSVRRLITDPADIGSQLHDYDIIAILRRQPPKDENGCRQQLVWYLSCHRRIPLGGPSALPASRREPFTVAEGRCAPLTVVYRCLSAPNPLPNQEQRPFNLWQTTVNHGKRLPWLPQSGADFLGCIL